MKLTAQAHALACPYLQAGDLAIDATAGNGHDTQFLANQVGETGRVLAFDLQPEAIEATKSRLIAANLLNVALFQICHSQLDRCLELKEIGMVAAVLFNLGYLPGGNKEFTTSPETTSPALRTAFHVLRQKGLILVIAYTGHGGGAEEAACVEKTLDQLSGRWLRRDPESGLSPRIFALEKS